MTGEELTTNEATIDQSATAPAVSDTSEADMGAVFDRLVTNNGADRGEGGKFTSPTADGAEKAASPDARGVPSGEEGAGAPADPPVVADTPAPAHLPGAIKSQWDKIPVEARAAIAAHQSEMDRKFGEIGKQYGAVKPIADKLAEASKFPDFAGMTPDQIAQGALELAAVQVNLGKNPVGTIIDIAKHYNVLPQLAQAFQGQGGDQAQLVTGLQQKIANLEAELSKVQSPERIREMVSTLLSERDAETVVQKFRAEEGKDYWADVEADMPEYVKKVVGRAEAQGLQMSEMDILKAAYDMAINANPDVRAKVRAAEAKATAGNTDPKKAAAVRNAVSINVKSSNSGKERVMTEEEAMASAYDRAMAS
jgi:hypothetical protein